MSSPPPSAAQVSFLGRKIVKAMLIIVFFWIFWKFGGFLMNLLIARYLGASREADAYFFVYKYILYIFIYSTTLKVLMPAFMPVFMEEMEEKGEEKAWEFVSAILNLILIGTGVLIGVGWLLAPWIASFAEGFDPLGQKVTIQLIRWMLPGALGMTVGVLTYALLNSYKVFNYPAAGDATQKLVWAVIFFGAFKLLGFAAVAIGFLLGYAAQLGVNAWGLRTKWRTYRPRLGLSGRRLAVEGMGLGTVLLLLGGWYLVVRHAASYRLLMLTGGTALGCLYLVWLERRAKRTGTALGKFAALSAPLFISVLFARYRDFATAFFQSYTPTGVFADLEYARSVGNLPTILVATALSFAMFPYLCELATQKDLATFATLMTRTLRLIALFFLPLTVIMMVLDEPLMQLIFDRGQFPLLHLHYAGQALSLFIFALFFYAIENVLMQSFFSLQQMWWPTALGILSAIFHTLFLWLGIRVLGFNYPYEIFVIVALSFPLSRIFKNILLLAIMRMRMPIIPARETLLFASKMALVCAAVGGAVYGSFLPLQHRFPVNSLKEREVLVDTFNYEPRGWFSLDADELEVIPGARSLCIRGPMFKELVLHRTNLPRKQLLRAASLRLWARSDGPATLSVRLRQEESSTEFIQDAILQDKGDWRLLEFAWEDFAYPFKQVLSAPRLNAARVTQLSLGVSLEKPGATVWIDALALVTRSGQILILDDFETKTVPWTPGNEAVVWSVEPNTDSNQRRNHALWVHYRRSGRRRVSLRRELTDFRREDGKELRFRAKATQPGQWSVQWQGASRSPGSQTISLDRPGTWQECALKLPEAGNMKSLGALFLEDTTPVNGGPPTAIQLWVDDLRLVRPDGTEQVLDDFEQELRGWSYAGGKPTIEDLGEGDLRVEQALSWPPGVHQVQRDLRAYRLEGTDLFRCKIKAEQSERVALLLETEDHNLWRHLLEVESSPRRKSYFSFLTDFQCVSDPGSGEIAPGQIERLIVTREKAQGGKLWLDNVAFKSRTPVVTYEVRKLIRVGIPVLVGTVVFLVLIFALRIEEADLMATWLRTEGRAKIKAQLRGKGGQ